VSACVPILRALALLCGLSLQLQGADETPKRAMWVYETEALEASPAARAELFQFCAARHITDLFWQMHFRKGTKEGTFEIQDAAALPEFLREATDHGLRIHALAGDPMQALTKNHERVQARIDALLAFNRNAGKGAPFAGLHLDVEPHAMPEWKSASDEEKCRLLTQFVELNAKVVEKLHAEAPGLIYGADIAFWLDKVKSDGSPAYPVTFHGVTKDATRHLLDMVDNLGVMGYRGKAEGTNGLIEIVRRTMAYADTVKPGRKVFVGVKMADIGSRNESFFGRTEQEMDMELRKVDDAFQQNPGYAGLAFFMYSAY
jgi:hypothetical protein